MSKMGICFGLALVFAAFYSCAPQTAPAVPEPAAPSLAVPASGQVPTGWEAEWEKVLKEANKEGRVILYGPPIAQVRQGFTEAFQKAYPGITLEYTAMGGAQASPKIKAEVRAGLYSVDLHIGGTTTILTQLRQLAVPIKPSLIRPEAKNPNDWLGGDLDFSDDAGELNLVFTIETTSRLVYNQDLVDPAELTSWWDLTKPKFREKIIMWDPRVAGSGLATTTFWIINPELGEDYVKAFAANKPVLTRDLRLQVESVGRGKYSLAVSADPPVVLELQKAGLPVKWAKYMKEGTYSSAAYDSVILFDHAPHPNATAVFLNWLMGKEGQTVWSRTSGFASRRLDVSTDHLDEAVRPKPDVKYVPNYKEKYVSAKDEIGARLNEIFSGF